MKDLKINKYTLDFCKKNYPADNEIGCNPVALAIFAILYKNLNLKTTDK